MIRTLHRLVCLMAVALIPGTAPALSAEGLAYGLVPAEAEAEAAAVLDVRDRKVCETASLPGARCLPLRDFFGPRGRLASFKDIRWLLGTVGLTGAETVAVAAATPSRAETAGAILWLAGQAEVRIVPEPVAAGDDAGGRSRSLTREAVFTAPMRDDRLVTHAELAADPDAFPLVDGRDEAAYRGRTLAGPRGGHISGADHVPLADPASAPDALPLAAEPVIYGHGPTDGLAMLARLVGHHGVSARLYPDGFSRWAADAALPVDAATYRSPTPAEDDT